MKAKDNKKLIPLAGSSGSYPEPFDKLRAGCTRFLLTIYEHKQSR